MTIEQKLKWDYGTTDDARLCQWMLADGTMINGSVEGHQRDVDHHEINQYYKTGIRETYDNGGLYIIKFMRRGNIRVSCSYSGFCFDMIGPPTQAQLDTMTQQFRIALRNCIPIFIACRKRQQPERESTGYTLLKYLKYLERYTRLNTEKLRGIIGAYNYEYRTV